ncbi:Ig-like domain-containing protein, partial [[Clostridium] spiroforme]|nr:Ig-like domain-containing protein [Thomasclavelia spiroformis]
TEDKTVTWTTGNKNVATVDQTGKVTAVDAGTTTITATASNGKTAICKVSVLSPITSVSLNKKETTIQKSGSETLQATINPSNTTEDKTLTWTSSNTKVATVDKNGKVTAVAEGNCTITVKTANG